MNALVSRRLKTTRTRLFQINNGFGILTPKSIRWPFSKSKKRIFVFPQKISYTRPSILKMSPLASAIALDFSPDI